MSDLGARSAIVLPPVRYPPELPVSARREDIARAITHHQVVIVAGETGSGKTTQIPKILLELGRGRAGRIGHTQPRRIAARTVAERIAEELATPLGDIVGYQVRFTDETSPSTLVKVMTDGILLAEIQHDPMLWAYDALIIDEAHERSLNIDFILGYLTTLLPRRPDLKIVITSATIDSELFAQHFAHDGEPAPVIEVTGRTYPVEVRYRPLDSDDGGPSPSTSSRPRAGADQALDQPAAICRAARELFKEGSGDILVFCSGEREIRDAAEALVEEFNATLVGGKKAGGPAGDKANRSKTTARGGAERNTPRDLEILPLFARLSAAEQHRVFEPHTARRIVLATNVAETSLTVPGIRYVIDPGTARISRYSKATKVQRLPIEPISQASANQRAGRCGRLADGICIRLYSKDDFDARPEFTEPEILRTSLASVILQMIAVGVASSPNDVVKFPFVQRPDARNVRDGVALLTELGALADKSTKSPESKTAAPRTTPKGNQQKPSSARRPQQGIGLTPLGRQLAHIPLDPRLGRMIIEADRYGVTREVLIIAAALTIQDPRERPLDAQEAADAAHARFADPTSDFLTFLNLWEYLRAARKDLSSSAFRRMARAEFLNYLRLREWQDLVTQLRRIVRESDAHNPPLRARRARPKPRKSENPTTSSDDSVLSCQVFTGSLAEGVPTRFTWPAEQIHRALLPGLLSQLGMRLETDLDQARASTDRRSRRRSRNEYAGPRNARFAIFPGSPLSAKPPPWIMAAELVETSRLWARCVAAITPEWAEDAASHLVVRSYSSPRWSSRAAAAMVDEKVLLFGLPIIAARPVPLARTDPEHAREIFIRSALVEGDWRCHHEFFAQNQHLIEEVEDLGDRTRRTSRALTLDPEDIVAFYDERLPASATSARAFDAWWKKVRPRHPDLLTLTPADLGLDDDGPAREGFPDQWVAGDFPLPLTYTYDPGADDDGATLHIPVAIANQIRPDGFDWHIPGLRTELVTALIKGLPKKERVELVPAADTARSLAPHLADPSAWRDRAGRIRPFTEVLSEVIRDSRDLWVPPEVWTFEKIPPHLRLRFVIENPRGEVMASGTDFLAVREEAAPGVREAIATLAEAAGRASARASSTKFAAAGVGASDSGSVNAVPESVEPAAPAPAPRTPPTPERKPTAPPPTRPVPPPTWGGERESLTTWDFGDLPREVEGMAGDVIVRGYPAVVVEGRRIALRVMESRERQGEAMERGVRALLLGELKLAPARITSRLKAQVALPLATSAYPNSDALVLDCQAAAVDALVRAHGGVPWTQGGYEALRARLRDEHEDRTDAIVRLVSKVLVKAGEVRGRIEDLAGLSMLSSLTEIRSHLARLLEAGFVARAGEARLAHFPRYLAADAYRLERLGATRAREERGIWVLAQVDEAYHEACAALPPGALPPEALAEVPWMIEELRVSLFAEQLGTAHPVSEKRIRKAIATGVGR